MKKIITNIASTLFAVAALFAVPAIALGATLSGDSLGTLAASNFTRNPNSNNSWAQTVSANPGDTVSIGIYYENTGTDRASNVVVRLSQPSAGQSTSFNFNGSVGGSNSNTLSGSAGVTVSSAQTLTFNGTVVWDRNTSGSGPALGNAQSIFSSSGLSLGDIEPGEFGTVVARFTVGNQQQQQDPTVTTLSASNIGQNSVTLNGSVDPRGSNANCFFQFGPTSSFGQTLNVSVGSSFQNVSATASGLNANTTYFYRLSCTANGTTINGSTLTFVTSQATQLDPLVNTFSATNINTSFATLNGSVDARGSSANCFFEFGPTSSFGQTLNVSVGSSFQNVSATATGLNSNTTYFFRLVCNANGRTVQGSILTFSTGQNNNNQDPFVTTLNATNIGQTFATLNGTVDARGSFANCFFEFGPSTSFGQTLGVSVGSSFQNVQATASNLNTNTTYFYRLVCNANGRTIQGSILSFSTNQGNFFFNQDPIVTTLSATNVNPNSATLNGLVDARNSNIPVCFFEYGTSAFFGNTTGTQSVGTTQTSVNSFVSNLSANTVYFYRLVCTANGRTIPGSTLSFSTGGSTINNNLSVVTRLPTEIFSDSARFNGTVTNNGQFREVNTFFEFGQNGFLNNQTPVQNLGTVSSANFSRVGLNLAPSTNYSVRAVAQDTTGQVARGNIVNFFTGPQQTVTPIVRTVVTPQVVTPLRSPIILSYGIDSLRPLPGDVVLYRVGWFNDSASNLTNGILRITLPQGVTFLDSQDAVSRDGNTLLSAVGSIPAGKGGAIFFRASIDRSVPVGTDLSMGIRFDFFNPSTAKNGDVTISGVSRVGSDSGSTGAQTTVTVVQPTQTVTIPSNSTDNTTKTDANTNSLSALINGAQGVFFPQTAVGWLLIAILVIAIIAMVGRFFGKNS